MLVIGAGFTGSITAILLHRAGVPVRLFDATAAYPNAFRAEKLEADKSRLLAACGLLDVVADGRSRIAKVESLRGGAWRTREHDDHHGIRYGDTVNRLRAAATKLVALDQRRVVGVDGDERGCRVRLADGGSAAGRLAVLASGSATLLRRAGIAAATAPMTSLTFGFDAMTGGGEPAPACNHHSPAPHRDGVHYATVFPIGDAVRINLFTAWGPDEPRIADVVGDPIGALGRLCPRLHERCPPLTAASRVQVARTDYHRVASATAGVVVIGEAYQSVAPATGMGLGKCLTDALVLARLVPRWLHSGRADTAAIEAFYRDPEKTPVDDTARDAWRWFHDSVHGRSLRSLLRRAAASVLGRLRGLRREAKREAVSRLAGALGMPRLLRRLRRRRVLVLMYHAVAADGAPFRRWTHVPESAFAWQLDWLQRHYRVRPLREVLAALRGDAPLDDNTAVLTFDDGFASVHARAFPRLRAAGLSAAVFLTTGLVGSRVLPWPAQLPVDAAAADAVAREFRPLTWAEADELTRSGLVELGAHGASHEILSRLAEPAMRREVHDSCAEIARRRRCACAARSGAGCAAAGRADAPRRRLVNAAAGARLRTPSLVPAAAESLHACRRFVPGRCGPPRRLHRHRRRVRAGERDLRP